MERKTLRGIIPAMVTPFDENGDLNEEKTRKLVRYLLGEGVHGLFIAGTNGEAHLMNHDEVVDLTRIVLDEVNGRVPVISGAGRCSTRETIVLANRLKKLGVDYISLVSPSYLVPNQDDLYNHYKTIAENVDAPLILYNIPSQTGLTIMPQTVEKLASIDNICGIKDSGGDIEIQKQYIDISRNNDFDVLNGSDSKILDTFKLGAVASVAATANVIPKIELDLYEYFLNGEMDKAQEMRNLMDPLRMNLKKTVAPCSMKKILNLMGIDVGVPRLPITEAKGEIVDDFKDMIREYGFNLEN